MELNFTELLVLLSMGFNIVSLLLVYRSIPREAWDKFLNKATTIADATPNQLDNKVLRIVKDTVNPLFDRIGVFDKATMDISPPPANDKMDNDLSAVG